MSFPSGWTRACPLVVQHGQVTANQTAFPVLLTEACLPAEMLTAGGPNAAQSDGGDIRFSSDSSGTTQLACEVVGWTQNANPALATAEIHVPVNILTAADVTIYVWYSAGGGLSQPAAGAAFGSQAVWDADYGAVYHLQTIGANTSGTSADSTVNANTLTNAGSSNVTAVAGKIGKGASFAASQYTLLKSSGLTNIPTGSAVRTIEVWFKRNSNTAAQEFFGWGNNSGGGARFAVYWQNDGWLYCECASNYARFLWTADTNWHHIVFTLPSGSTTASVLGYLDGVAQSLDANGGAINTVLGSVTLSGFPTVASAYYDGLLDEGRISKVARSASWIATQYNNQSSPSTFVVVGTPGATFIGVSKVNVYAVLGADQELSVTKTNVYAVLVPNTGVTASKNNIYAVLAPHFDLDVSKTNVYALLIPGPTGAGNRAYVFGIGWVYHANHS